MSNRGFTLLEMMVAVGIFTIVMGTILGLSLAFANSTEAQELRITTADEARRAFLVIGPMLRQAASSTINWDDLPGDSVTFQVIRDSGTGWAIDTNGEMDLSGQITIQRDADDENDDGITMSQLVLIDDDGDVRVLANDLQTGEGDDATVDIPDGVGFWVAPQGAGLEVTVRTEGQTRRGHVFTATITEFVFPRN